MRRLICIYLITIVFVINSIFANQNNNLNKNPFPNEVVIKMEEDINGFIEHLSINEGQSKEIIEFKKTCDVKKLLVFLDPNFSPENMKKFSNIKYFFKYIIMLDIISNNYKLNLDYGTWFLSKLFSLVIEKPNLYMESFLSICQQSDGGYAEWFADPLTEIIKKYPTEFFNAFNKVNTADQMCAILVTGDSNKVIESMNILQIKFKDKKNLKISYLLDCIKQ